MRRLITLTLFISFSFAVFASENTIVVPKKKATEIMVPVGNTGKFVSLMELSHMKVRDYESLSAHRLTLVDKLGFKLAQRQLRRVINADGSLNQKRVAILNGKLAHPPAASEKSRHYFRLFIIFLVVAVGLGIIGLFVPFFWILSSLAWLGTVIFFILWLISLSGAM
jgi:hypothetical protein